MSTTTHDETVASIIRSKLTPERIFDIDHRVLESGPCEQSRLGGAVSCECAVVVEMIVSEIREHRSVDAQPRDAFLIQGMRGDLHPEMTHTRIAQFRRLTM